jgi:hypothetical protein
MVGALHHRPERCLMRHAVLANVDVLVAIPAAQNRMQPPPTPSCGNQAASYRLSTRSPGSRRSQPPTSR